MAGVLAAAPVVYADRPLGIDVSFWQGTITYSQWVQVHNSGKVFAFAKATQGIYNSYNDVQFVNNMTQGRAAGMLMGAYHFADPDLYGAAAEANHFVDIAGPYMTSGYLRPVLDLERGSGLGKTALSQWANTFMNTVQSRTGVEPLIYCNVNYATNYLDSTLSSRDVWIAIWPTNPDPQNGNPATGVFPTWAFWQYSDHGSVPGISGNVDLDVFHGTLTELQAFVVTDNDPPMIDRSPATLTPSVIVGLNAANQTFTIANSGAGTLSYSITDDADWLNVAPSSGTCTTETDTITVSYPTASLAIGVYDATITIVDFAAGNSPQTIDATLTVLPIPGDYDGDGDIDGADVNLFIPCLSGPDVVQPDPACEYKDLDGDSDVDSSDFGILQKCLTGPAVPATLGCTTGG